MSTAPDPLRYRKVIGSFATGVAIVTCSGPDGPAGLTTNAVTSLSLQPLLLLVCFDNGSRTHGEPMVWFRGAYHRLGSAGGSVPPAAN